MCCLSTLALLVLLTNFFISPYQILFGCTGANNTFNTSLSLTQYPISPFLKICPMTVIWGLDLHEMQWYKFGGSYMFSGVYHLQTTKMIVYQLAMILCIVSESVGTAALSGNPSSPPRSYQLKLTEPTRLRRPTRRNPTPLPHPRPSSQQLLHRRRLLQYLHGHRGSDHLRLGLFLRPLLARTRGIPIRETGVEDCIRCGLVHGVG